MKKLLPILLVSLLLQQISFAQKYGQALVDSLVTQIPHAIEDTNKVNLLNDICFTYRDLNPNKCIEYGQQGLALAENLKWEKGIATSYNIMGLAYSNIGKYDQALKMFFSSLKINESVANKGGMATNYNNIGLLYWSQKDYNEALAIYSKVIKLLENSNKWEILNHPYNNIAGIYADMGNYEEALKNYKISLKMREKVNDKTLIADSYTGLGIIYQRMKRFDEALMQFRQAYSIYEETKNDFALAGINASFGEIDAALKKFSEAKIYFDKAMELYKKTGDPQGYYFIYEDLATLESAVGNHQKALENYKLFIIYRDSTTNQENSRKLVQTMMQYDFDKKENFTRAEQEKKDIVQRIIRNSITGGLAGALLFLVIVYRQRNKISKEKKRSEELLLNILPSEVAEELKTTGATTAKDFSEVTVLFTDFKNFTAMSEQLTAQELVNEINYCYSAFDNIITKHGIEKIKTIGDSYMCAGGLPVANTTHAEETVSAALEIRDFMEAEQLKRSALNKPFFEIRIGCNTGPVVAGIVGIKKFAYDIWGDTVNIASRMESSGAAGKVNISQSTYELVKTKFTCTHRGKITAKNKGEIDMYFVDVL